MSGVVQKTGTSSSPVFSGVRVTQSLVLFVCFVDRCLSICTFSFDHCVVCSSSICGFWLPVCYLQALFTLVGSALLIFLLVCIVFFALSSFCVLFPLLPVSLCCPFWITIWFSLFLVLSVLPVFVIHVDFGNISMVINSYQATASDKMQRQYYLLC